MTDFHIFSLAHLTVNLQKKAVVKFPTAPQTLRYITL